MSENTKQGSFIKGAAILTAAGLAARVMGFGYRVILTRIIGAEGMGLYQMAYPIYTVLLVVSRSGIPVALAKLIADKIAADKRKEAYKIFKVARKMSFIVGLIISIIMALSARPLISLLSLDPRSYYAVLAISPAIFVVSIMASYRGFFQGLQDMVPTAKSQILEQFIRMFTMVGLVVFLVPYGLDYAAAGASFGAVSGAFGGLLILLYIYAKRREKIFSFLEKGSDSVELSTKNVVKRIISLGVPITLGALVMPLMSLVDLVFVPNRLQAAGYMVREATALYGMFSAVAMPLVNFPTIITVSLAASLVPAIAEAFTLGKEKLINYRTQTALRLTVLISLPAAAGLFLLAEPLTEIIFAEPGAAVPLRFVAWGVFFIALQQTSTGILNGIGKTSIPARNLMIGAVFNGFINYTLTAVPAFGIRGAALGTTIGFAIAALLNLYYVKKESGFIIDAKTMILKPLTAVFLMGVFVEVFNNLLNRLLEANELAYAYQISTFTTVAAAAIFYFVLLLILKEIKYNDLAMLPLFGKKLAELLRKYRIIE
ncbi:stage V sporulation protein B [Halanaerobium saccharolyticum]|uniref:Stage V sporulation protein B n=1 Tax=Halanaerobium saccharolyticum TaxID=43595 RepID=A0A4R7Z0X5_9FIRM|nr:polysaccharide biosynthesis protein [Halanaerobium saccharolyticum]RAK06610.1 stage V sporulation protein B [Halanaerobium saccharolyticum]TDW01149.1 stage V sporulation protein B [Halanaerobium saccharolyticum]TDX51200.1 stage V sporulation protein B [Halanaerobium saccharolyticum]